MPGLDLRVLVLERWRRWWEDDWSQRGFVYGGGSGSVGRVALWQTANQLTSDPELYYDSSTNRLGIGTATPSSTLNVAGTAHITGNTLLDGSLVVWGPIGQGTAPVAGYSFYGAYAGYFGGNLQVTGAVSFGVIAFLADPATSRTTLGLGTLAVQDAANVWITGGGISGLASFNVNQRYIANPAGSNIFGIYSDLAAAGGTLRYLFYSSGDAPSYLAGALGVGAGPLTGYALTVLGNVIFHSDARIGSGSGGVRYAAVGTPAADGYSNAIGFGWDGNVRVRVDSTQVGAITLFTPSDVRVKQDVQEDVPGLAAVCALRPISFTYDQAMRPLGFPRGRHYGLLAQEAQGVVPLAVRDAGIQDGWLGVEYDKLVPVVIQAIKELTARVIALEGE